MVQAEEYWTQSGELSWATVLPLVFCVTLGK